MNPNDTPNLGNPAMPGAPTPGRIADCLGEITTALDQAVAELGRLRLALGEDYTTMTDETLVATALQGKKSEAMKRRITMDANEPSVADRLGDITAALRTCSFVRAS